MPSRPDLHDNSRPHVVVIGAGIVGATLAHELSGRGAWVTVLDRERPAAGATGVAFAWLTNQTYFRNGHSLSDGSSRHYFGLHRLALGAWRRLHHRIGDDLGVRWHGTLQLAPEHGEDHDLLERDLARRLAWGSPSYRVTAAEARTLVPGLNVDDTTSGFRTADEGSVDPNAAVAAVLAAAAALGVHLEQHTEVLSVEGGADGHATAVHTATGRIDCDHVVIAAGADSGVLLAELGITAPHVESSGSIVHLAPLPAFLDPVLLGPTVHAIQRRDGRVVIARHYSGSPVGDPDHLDAPGLLADAAEMLPPLRQAEIEKVTVGRRIIPADGLPIIGRSPVLGNVHSVTTNAGITLGPMLAHPVQSDRQHAVLEVVGTPGRESVDELRQRAEGLLVAGVRYLLADLAEADPGDAVVGVLAETARRLEERQGWLRVNRQDSSLPVGGLTEATLGDLFAIYRAFALSAGRWDGAHA